MKIIYLSINMAEYAAATYQHLFLEGMRSAATVYSYGPGFPDYSEDDRLSDIGEKSGWGTDFDAVFIGHSWLQDGAQGPVDVRNVKIDVDRPVFFFLNKEYAQLEDKISAIAGYKPVTVFSHHHDVESLVGVDLPWEVVNVPFAADPTLFRPAAKRHDLFFSGILRNPTFPDSQAADRVLIQSQLFRVLGGIRLGSKVSFDVSWNSFTANRLIDRINRYRRLDDSEYVALMGSSRIVLNSLSPVNLVGTRFFETMLSETVCLSPSTASFASFLTHGVNCYFYESPEQFVETVEYLLDRPEELKSIAVAARKDALQNHTWENRVNQVLEVMSKWS